MTGRIKKEDDCEHQNKETKKSFEELADEALDAVARTISSHRTIVMSRLWVPNDYTVQRSGPER